MMQHEISRFKHLHFFFERDRSKDLPEPAMCDQATPRECTWTLAKTLVLSLKLARTTSGDTAMVVRSATRVAEQFYEDAAVNEETRATTMTPSSPCPVYICEIAITPCVLNTSAKQDGSTETARLANAVLDLLRLSMIMKWSGGYQETLHWCALEMLSSTL